MANILAVDDDAHQRAILRFALEEAGHRVLEAGDGVEAMRACRSHRIDLVASDMFMPGANGLEMIRELRRDFPAVKIVAMSDGGFDGMVDMLPIARRFGAAAVLYKPFDRHTLLAMVESILPGSALRSPAVAV